MNVGTVTKVTKSTYYVDGSTTPSSGYYSEASAAFEGEYIGLFRIWDVVFGRKHEGWTLESTLRCIFKVRRLQSRLNVKLKKTFNS